MQCLLAELRALDVATALRLVVPLSPVHPRMSLDIQCNCNYAFPCSLLVAFGKMRNAIRHFGIHAFFCQERSQLISPEGSLPD